ncbi:MAG: FAD-dependent oxidoreductase [Chloroflexi bacterium]|nr:FAD-dependent oxidoreductase [Chloroflexota bacterium]MBI3741237.1 FAD-dependent oxidoreductase [Chloroflexota bacterium]
MPKPVILTVDDDRAVLNAVERDLRQKYGRDYRVLKAESGASALDALTQLHARGDTAALFVADQRMPEMNGVQFLEAARKIFPDARKILLTAYADTQAAIDAINKVGLDYYLVKPWDPPEENFYPIVNDLLDEWKQNVQLPFEGIRVAGSLWSNNSHRVKEFLTRHQIPYLFLDIEKDFKARAMVEQTNHGALKIPTLYFPDGVVMSDPALQQLAEKCGVQMKAALPFYDLIIVGAGPGGLAAAVYGSSDGLKVLLIERAAPGGQAGSSPKIENLMGFPSGISGMDLTRRAVTQAKRFGVEFLSTQEAILVERSDPYRMVTLADGTKISAHAILLATGSSFNILKMPGAAELTGAGVYYGAAYTEAANYRDQNVCVVGGANSAGQGAMFLSRFAAKVTMLVRTELTTSQYLTDLLRANEKIEIRLNTDLLALHGKEKLEALTIRDTKTQKEEMLDAAALFVFIGVKPGSALAANIVTCDEKGYVVTGRDLIADGKKPTGWNLEREPFVLETSTPGIFAAGDVRKGTVHRIASAAGEGAMAVMEIREYLKGL